MADDHPTGLRLATQLDRLRADLPPAWRGPVIGPAIPGWLDAPGAHIDNLHLTDLPEPLHTELAWIAHWQEIIDGTPTSVQTINQFGLAYRLGTARGRDLPTSILDIDWQAAEALLG
ncbi:hypothetical protein [Nocardia sp. NPDC057030]|uniref:hypothetical protein n=1 Tax=unclassified Nocardia TaxID=2637762 RepID=UPI00362B0F9F